MPVYSYQCYECDHKFDEEVSLTLDVNHPDLCPQCGGDDVYRDYRAPATHIKGGTGAARHSFKRNNNE